MKCELCHESEAKVAITRDVKGAAEELYVCRECAAQERKRRQQKSQRTRKAAGLAPGMSITVNGTTVGEGEEPPPIIGAILDAVHGMVNDLERAQAEAKPRKEPKFHVLPTTRAEAAYRIGSRLHLEGLHLIGELEAVHRATHALGMRLSGVTADGVRESGHAYRLEYSGPSEPAKRLAADLLAQERNARVRLFEEVPRVFGDSLCRALAILKNCRLLSPGELFDLLSPLRLAAIEGMLDGIGLDEIEQMMLGVDLGSAEDKLEPEERDRVDSERADEMNARFEEVVLNERAEERFL